MTTHLVDPPLVASSPAAVDVSDRAGRLLGIVASIAAAVDVSDRAGRLLGIVASIASPVDVSDRAGRLLGIVASIASPVDVSDRAGRLLGIVASIAAAVDVSDRAGRLLGISTALQTPATLTVTVTGGANAIATATLPAAGAGLFHYITHLDIRRVATAALAGGALLAVTTTNLAGAPSWRTGNQASITGATADGMVLVASDFVAPLKSAAANAATTIVCPAAGLAVSWQIVVHYYTGT